MMADENTEQKPARLKNLRAVHIFTCGNYGAKGDWTEEKVDQLNKDYRVEIEKAKLKIRHNDQQRQHGFFERVWRRGRKVFADLTGISQELSDGITSGGYEDRSAEIFMNHSVTGRPYWKGLAFLGAESPHVKGLEPLKFTDSNGAEYACFSDDESGGAEYVRMSLDEVDMTIEKDEKKKPTETPAQGGVVTMSEDDYKAFKAQGERLAKIEKDNIRLAAQARSEKVKGTVARLKSMDGGPRVLPKHEGKVAKILELFASMGDDTVTFSEDGKEATASPFDLFVGYAEGLPPLVKTGPKVTTGEKGAVSGAGNAQTVNETKLSDQAFAEAVAKFPDPGPEQTRFFEERFDELYLEAKEKGTFAESD